MTYGDSYTEAELRRRQLSSAQLTNQFQLNAEHLPYAVAVIGIVIAFAAAPIIRKRLKQKRKK